jgi:hypothetical protein
MHRQWRRPWKEFLGHPWWIQATHSKRKRYLANYKGGASPLASVEGYLLRGMLEMKMIGTNIYWTQHLLYSKLYQHLSYNNLQQQQEHSRGKPSGQPPTSRCPMDIGLKVGHNTG